MTRMNLSSKRYSCIVGKIGVKFCREKKESGIKDQKTLTTHCVFNNNMNYINTVM